jgi:hypothetical protein
MCFEALYQYFVCQARACLQGAILRSMLEMSRLIIALGMRRQHFFNASQKPSHPYSALL